MFERRYHEFLNWVSGLEHPQLAAAIALLVAATGWVIGVRLHADPTMLIWLPAVALLLGFLGSIFVVVGAIGWVALQVLRLILLWRAHEEKPGKLTTTQKIWVFAVVIFLGVPEFWEATAWWQEHALRFIHEEPDLLEGIKMSYYRNSESILGFALMALIFALVFSGLYKSFGTQYRRASALIKGLLDHRDWRLPIILIVAIVAIAAGCAAFPNANLQPWFEVIASAVIVLVIWLLLPVIRPNLRGIIFLAACMGPAFIFVEHVIHEPALSRMVASALWGGWLFSIRFISNKLWRIVYWPVVAGFLGFIVAVG